MTDNPDDDRDQRLDAWLRAGADDLAAAVASHVDLPGTLADVTARAGQRPGSTVRIPAQRGLPAASRVAVAHAAAISWAPGDALRRRIFISIGAALVLLTLVLIAAYSSGAPPAVIPPPDQKPTVSTPVDATRPSPAATR